MKLHLLGVNGPFPESHSATSGYLLEAGSSLFQLDFGCGILSSLTALTAPESVSAVLMSHWHYDHAADLPVLMYRLEALHGVLPVFGPADPSSPVFNLVSSSPCFSFTEVDAGTSFEFGGVQISVTGARHPVPAVGYRISCEGSVGDAAYWTFEPTTTSNCYYVRNLLTGRYIQGYEKVSGTAVKMGSEGVEYYVAAQTSEGGRYGFACTSVTPHDFSAGTIGLNLRAESNQADCLVQTYAAAAGTNHRSFWTLDIVSDEIVTGPHIVEPELSNSKCYDLQGRLWTKYSTGVRIQQGRKYLKSQNP